ncbi:hypothetical protein ACFW5S_05990 [Streptomyces olivaceus]|uniref:hypothetical protein n=1 Tax=Streptomyces olivaceus TaxID=47716 RepID=UPI0033BC00C2
MPQLPCTLEALVACTHFSADSANADLVFALAANSLLTRATAGAAPDAWRRQAAFLLDGLRAGATRAQLPADRLTEELVRDALSSLGERA